MPNADSIVLVIDDDPNVRASVGRLLRSLGMDVQLFGYISDFIESDPPDGFTCLVLDARLPGQSGLELQRELAAANRQLPIVFITGHGDIPMSVQAMKGGAIEFLTMPIRDQGLLDAIQLGLSRDRARRNFPSLPRSACSTHLSSSISRLTPTHCKSCPDHFRSLYGVQLCCQGPG
jgi:FixJ family two-component response regulator